MDEFVFDYLKGNKKKLKSLSDEAVNSLSSLSKKYQLIGFISSVYKFSNEERSKELNLIRRTSVTKNLMMASDLDMICKKFNKKNINYCVLKGPALVHAGIYKSGIRFFRDLDILVSKEDLDLAFKTLNQLGFNYLNKLSKNNCDVLGNMHHLPVMVNNNCTYLELHHRVTKRSHYLKCPISEDILKDKVFHDGVYIPSTDALIGHALYHGILHHENTIGPITLFDLKEITRKYRIDLALKNRYVNYLNLEDELRKINNLFKSIDQEDYSSSLMKKINAIKDNIVINEITDKKIYIFSFNKILKRISNGYFSKKIQLAEFNYQTRRTDPKFIFFYLLDLFGSIKRGIRFF